jgi:starch phosphorylase
MFGGYHIDAITNGVHAATWVSEPFRTLFDRHIPSWRADNFSLRYAVSIPTPEIWDAHVAAKLRLLELVNRHQSPPCDPTVLTIGFGRRASPYKRADLLVSDPERLRTIARTAGGLQVVYAGKAHPHDEEGKRIIEHVFRAREALGSDVSIVYLEDYDMETARFLTAGADVWLNTPQPPLEASGTSGMKAAINGVPNLSILDGWWIEGCIEGVTGRGVASTGDAAADAKALYGKLETAVLPVFHAQEPTHAARLRLMKGAIAKNAAYFNSHRMMRRYSTEAYLR